MKDTDFWHHLKQMLIVPGAVALVALATFAWTRLFYVTLFSPGASLTKAANDISNDALLGLIGILTTVAGVLAYIFHQVIRRDLHAEIQQLAADERAASRAEAENAAARVFWMQFYLGGGRDKALLREALRITRQSVARLEKLERSREENKDLVLRCKNNLAFLLAAHSPAELTPEDKRLAYILSEEIYHAALRSNRVEFPYSYAWEATRALVLARFHATEKSERKKASTILDALLRKGELPPFQREEFREQWRFIFNKRR